MYTPERLAGLKPAKKGEVRNPMGRPKGARSKLQEAFIEDLQEAWKANGKEALIAMIADKPADFCRMVASLMPKNINITEDGDSAIDKLLDSIGEDNLATFVEGVRLLAIASAGGETIDQTEAASEPSGIH